MISQNGKGLDLTSLRCRSNAHWGSFYQRKSAKTYVLCKLFSALIAEGSSRHGLRPALGAGDLRLFDLGSADHAEIGFQREVFPALKTLIDLYNLGTAGRTEPGFEGNFGKTLRTLELFPAGGRLASFFHTLHQDTGKHHPHAGSDSQAHTGSGSRPDSSTLALGRIA